MVAMTSSSWLSSTAESMFTSSIKSNDPLGLFSTSDCETLGGEMGDTTMPLAFPPLEVLPCGNICASPAKLPCGRCKLVSYCSQKCEREHRSAHKRNCNAPPSSPNFRDTDSHDDNQRSSGSSHTCEETAQTISQCRNLPAVDIVNLKNNEKDNRRDFSLAFLACGELQNVVRTVNALGSDYTGRLHILLNDESKSIVSRNIVLLLILGAMQNEQVAADIALHFWYSVFLPEAYRLRILAMLALILQQHADKTEPLSVSLGRRAKLTCLAPRDITDHLLYTAGPTLSTSRARDEYERVTPARLDARNRALVGVKPCHSLAFMAFWRSGVVLPFSVNSDHHTVPNASFFSTSGTLLQDRAAIPLASWDPNEVVKSGQAHGTQPEDIFGCLYFFLSDQLRTFAKRIRELDVTIHVFNAATQTLAQDIVCGEHARHYLTSRTRFDRIDLGAVLADAGRARDALVSWAPLLAEGNAPAILAVFPDWAQRDGSAAGADDARLAPVVDKLIKLGRVSPGTTLADARVTQTTTEALDAAYDNSKAFAGWVKAALGDALRETALKRRLRHTVVPQRFRMPVDAKASDLPHLPDDESWYRCVRLAKLSFTARYVELARATT